MLGRLYIQNFALIERMEIIFSSGLNILTGETGAGKSILLGAIGLILGRRADTSVVIGEEKCITEAEFHLTPELFALLSTLESENEFDLEEDILTVRREITKSGKSRAFINDSPVNLQTLKAVTDLLIDIHGQHDGQQLADETVQADILDRYAGLGEEVKTFSLKFNELKHIDKDIKELIARESDAKRQTDFLTFQAEELRKAALNPEEEDRTEKELQLLENAGLVGETLSRTVHILDGADESVTSQLALAIKSLEKVSIYSPAIASETLKISDALTLLNDASLELHSIAEGLDLDPKRLDFLTERMNVINKLKLKYNVKTVEQLLKLLAEYESQIESYQSIEEQITELRSKALHLAEELSVSGLELEQKRLAAASELEAAVGQTLKEVGLNKTVFKVEILRRTDPKGLLKAEGQTVRPDERGINSVRFLVRTNEGLPFGTLAQVASGGEISRVMLAIKSALAEKMQLSVLIFDEIDTGISGETARKVGKVMEKLSDRHQLLTVTHLPQIASRGKHHFFIFKEARDGRTVSQIRKLNSEERIIEIAKMMSGENPTAVALQSARESLSMP